MKLSRMTPVLIIFAVLTTQGHCIKYKVHKSKFGSFHKLDISCSLIQRIRNKTHLLNDIRVFNNDCGGEDFKSCRALSIGERCGNGHPIKRYETGVGCKFQEHFGWSDAISMNCSEKTFIKIKGIRYLALYGLEKVQLKQDTIFQNLAIESLKPNTCDQKLYMKSKKCITYASKQKVKRLNKKSMGHKISISISNVKVSIKNSCWWMKRRIPSSHIDCNRDKHMYGNGCQADYVRILYSCLKHQETQNATTPFDQLSSLSSSGSYKRSEKADNTVQEKVKNAVGNENNYLQWYIIAAVLIVVLIAIIVSIIDLLMKSYKFKPEKEAVKNDSKACGGPEGIYSSDNNEYEVINDRFFVSQRRRSNCKGDYIEPNDSGFINLYVDLF